MAIIKEFNMTEYGSEINLADYEQYKGEICPECNKEVCLECGDCKNLKCSAVHCFEAREVNFV